MCLQPLRGRSSSDAEWLVPPLCRFLASILSKFSIAWRHCSFSTFLFGFLGQGSPVSSCLHPHLQRLRLCLMFYLAILLLSFPVPYILPIYANNSYCFLIFSFEWQEFITIIHLFYNFKDFKNMFVL